MVLLVSKHPEVLQNLKHGIRYVLQLCGNQSRRVTDAASALFEGLSQLLVRKWTFPFRARTSRLSATTTRCISAHVISLCREV